jgi:hypothetical protein
METMTFAISESIPGYTNSFNEAVGFARGSLTPAQ